MGCSVSKELVDTPASNQLVPNKLSLQVHDSLHPTNAGLIAAILSAAVHKKPADSHDLLLSPSHPLTGDFPQIKAGRPCRKGFCGFSASEKHASEAVCEKSMKLSKLKLDSVNTCKLTNGLEYASAESKLQESAHPSPEYKLYPLPALIPSKTLASEDITLSSRKKARTKKLKLLSCDPNEAEKTANETNDGNLPDEPSEDQHMEFYALPEYDASSERSSCTSTDIKLYTQSSTYSPNPISNETPESNQSVNQNDRLQLALSVKYMLSENHGEQDCSSDIAQVSTPSVVDPNTDNQVSHESRLSEIDCSTMSSPDFSASASLKDWLPTNTNSKTHSSDFSSNLDLDTASEIFQTTCQPQIDAKMSGQCIHKTYNTASSNNPMWQQKNVIIPINSENHGGTTFDRVALDNSVSVKSGCIAGSQSSDHGKLHRDQYPISSNGQECYENNVSRRRKLSNSSLNYDGGITRARRDSKAVVFYSTTLQDNTKLFQDCNLVRDILNSILGTSYNERSISECPEYGREIRHDLDMPMAVVPTLCIKGRYVVGMESILQLHEKGVLCSMIHEALDDELKTRVRCICRGNKILVCPLCKGRRKINGIEGILICRNCSGTGFLRCPNC